MYQRIMVAALAQLALATGMQAQQQFTIDIYNPAPFERTDIPVCIALEGTERSATWASVFIDGKETAAQLDDLDADGMADELCFVCNMNKRQTLQANVTLFNSDANANFQQPERETTARTYAEIVLRNPAVKEKNRHDIYLDAITVNRRTANPYNVLHHHGVAFESELIAMRIYLDKRQTIDLYGKFQKQLELEQTQFYTSHEQKQQGFGDDVLWVGNSFGLGALRGWNGRRPTMIDPVERRTQRILAKGPVRTIVEVKDEQWVAEGEQQPIDMTLRYTLYAGHRDVEVQAMFNKDISNRRLATGMVDVKGSQEMTDHHGLRACWGTDWPASDTLNWKRETVGLAILIPEEHIESELPRDGENYTFVVKTATNNTLHYRIAFASDNESFGMHTEKEWFSWVKAWRKEVEQPVKITVRGRNR